MLINHEYICLSTPNKLSKNYAMAWRDLVKKFAPNGAVGSASIMVQGHQKTSVFYSKKEGNEYWYIIPLTRDLTNEEAGVLAIAWSHKYDGDFEIEFSQATQMQSNKTKLRSDALSAIAEAAAKISHNKWVNAKVSEGWNYGPSYNRVMRKHPMLLPWEQLGKQIKEHEIDRALDLLEFIESANLRLIAK